MDFDFSALDEIAGKKAPFPAASEKKTFIDTPKQGQSAAGNAGDKVIPAAGSNAAKERQDAPQDSGLAKLEQIESQYERSVAAFKEQQDGIKASAQIKAEIIKDVRAGLDPIALFLKAVYGLAQATGDKVYCKQVMQEVMDIWGAGLLQKLPLEMELAAVESRLKLLSRKHIYESDERSRKRIETAIAEHEARRAQLMKLLGTYKGPFNDNRQGEKDA